MLPVLDENTDGCYPDATMPDALENVGQFIRERREARGMSQEELAKKAGTTQQNVGRIEAGKIRHSRYVAPMLEALGTDLSKALPAVVEPGQIIPKELLVGDNDFPIFAAAEGGEGATIINYDPLDYVKRPAPLLHVKEGYGVVMVEESMIPAFWPGDIALVNPRQPPRRGKNALFLGPEGQTVRALVKQYEGQSGGEWRVSQWNPREHFSLSKAEWPRCFAIVGKYDAR